MRKKGLTGVRGIFHPLRWMEAIGQPDEKVYDLYIFYLIHATSFTLVSKCAKLKFV